MSQVDETPKRSVSELDSTSSQVQTDTKSNLTDSKGRLGDKIFHFATSGAGVVIFIILFLVSTYLLMEAIPALGAGENTTGYDTDGQVSPTLAAAGYDNFWSYVAPLVGGTLMTAVISLLLATPLAIGVALYISHYAPKKISASVGYVIDILAAIPSVVYGAWGLAVLAPAIVPVYEWLENSIFGYLPFFASASATGRTILTAGIVLSVMILPIITSQCREIFIQTPNLHQEAALALGTTKWDMVKATVFPFARNGIVSAVMLGLGRALGETMAVTMVLSPGEWSWNIIDSGNKTIPAEIALQYPEAFGMRQSELIAAGLVLFVITFLVNALARAIVSRYSEFSGAN